MTRPKEEIRAEISDLLGLDEWSEVETQKFKRLIREHPKDTKEDREYIGWMEEGAFLLQVKPMPPFRTVPET